MQNNRRNILTAVLCCSFILFVFYGDLLEYPTIRTRHQIHTIHLDVRLDKNLKALENPLALTSAEGLEDPLQKSEVAKDSSQETKVAKDRRLYTEDQGDTLSNQEVLLEYLQDIEVHKNASRGEKGLEDHLSDVEVVEDASFNQALDDIQLSNAYGQNSLLGKFKVQNSSSHILEKHFLIFLVPSTPDSWEYRNSMRTKWLNLSYWRKEEFQEIDARHLDFKLMFIIGTDVKKNYSQGFLEELSQNDDMYLMDIPESREILKDKVLFGMKESIKRFDYDFLIKFDHDTLVDLPRLGSGLPTLTKKNLFTGSCGYHLWFQTIQRKVHYCSGGAYILSSDVVQKIAALSKAETNVTLGKQEPEDAYIGLLVKTVNKKFNISKLRHKHRRDIVNRYLSRPGHYWFRTWFFHGVKGWSRMDRAFNCRVTADLDACPPRQFFYKNENATHCVCDDNKDPLWRF